MGTLRSSRYRQVCGELTRGLRSRVRGSPSDEKRRISHERTEKTALPPDTGSFSVFLYIDQCFCNRNNGRRHGNNTDRWYRYRDRNWYRWHRYRHWNWYRRHRYRHWNWYRRHGYRHWNWYRWHRYRHWNRYRRHGYRRRNWYGRYWNRDWCDHWYNWGNSF